MIARTLTKLRGSATIAANLAGQKRVPFQSREKIHALRDRRIREMVTFAAQTVPYYRELFKKLGIDPRSITGAAELDRLPLTEKTLVRARPELFRSEASSGQTALSFLTSGSTGTPTMIYHDRRSLILNIPYGERERDPVIRICGRSFRPKELYIGNETAVIRQVTAFYQQATMLPVRPRRRFISVREQFETVAAMVNSERPDVLVGYGGWIDLFFKTVTSRNISLRPPKMVMYIAESLPPGGRAHIEANFGIPVLSRYCAAEAFKIGYLCDQRRGFHVHEDICHTRIVGKDGQTLPPGEAGEIIISNLINRGTVLLNYRIGDMGSISDEPCPCGRTFRLLSELEGRVEDILRLPDGRFVHPRAFWEIFKHHPEILQYQVIQHEPGLFEVKLVTADEERYQSAIAKTRPRLHELLGANVHIDAHGLRQFVREEGRKFRTVASLCKRPVIG